MATGLEQCHHTLTTPNFMATGPAIVDWTPVTSTITLPIPWDRAWQASLLRHTEYYATCGTPSRHRYQLSVPPNYDIQSHCSDQRPLEAVLDRSSNDGGHDLSRERTVTCLSHLDGHTAEFLGARARLRRRHPSTTSATTEKDEQAIIAHAATGSDRIEEGVHSPGDSTRHRLLDVTPTTALTTV
jgi:hypothetical protein